MPEIAESTIPDSKFTPEIQSAVSPPKKNSAKPIIVIVSIGAIFFLILMGGYAFFTTKKDSFNKLNRNENEIVKNSLDVDQDQSSELSMNSVSPAENIIEKSSTASLQDVPQLYSELNWKKTSLSDTKYSDLESVYVYSDDDKYFADGAILPVEVWVSEKDFANHQLKTDFSRGLIGYYESHLNKSGWAFEGRIEGYKITSTAGDGPLSSIWGIVGINNDSVRAVTIAEEWSTIEAGPINVKYYLFVSEVITLEDLLQLVKSN